MAIFNSYVSLPEGIFRTPIPPIPETMKIMILGFTTLLLQAYKYRVLKFTWIPLKKWDCQSSHHTDSNPCFWGRILFQLASSGENSGCKVNFLRHWLQTGGTNVAKKTRKPWSISHRILPTSRTSSVRSIEYHHWALHSWFSQTLSAKLENHPQRSRATLFLQPPKKCAFDPHCHRKKHWNTSPTITGAAPFSSNSSPPGCELWARPPSSSPACPAAAARRAPRALSDAQIVLPSSQTWCYYRLSVGCTLHTWIHEWIIMNKCIKKNQQIKFTHIFNLDMDMIGFQPPKKKPPIEHNSFPILPRADLVEFDGPGHGHSCPEVGEAHFDQLLGVQGAVPVALDRDQSKMGFTCGKRKKYGRKSLEISGFQGIFIYIFFMTFPPAWVT